VNGVHRYEALAAAAAVVAVIVLAASILRPDDGSVASASLPASPPPTSEPSSPAESSEIASEPPPSTTPSTEPSTEPSAGPAEPSGLIAFESEVRGERDIYTVQADGTDEQPFATTVGDVDWDPEISFDGSQIAWTAQDRIAIADLDGANEFSLPHHAGREAFSAWSPNGERIAYSTMFGEDPGDIFIAAAEEGGDPADTIQLTVSGQADYEPSWAPDGLALVFTRGTGDRTDLYRIAVPASVGDPIPKAIPLTDNDDERITDEDPAWSPDGDRIAFSRTPADGDEADIWILTLSTMEERRVARTANIDESDPAWSPSGQFIVYHEGDGGDLVIVGVEDGEIVETLDVRGNAGHASWR
jgi:Tol biopolymer transport system component